MIIVKKFQKNIDTGEGAPVLLEHYCQNNNIKPDQIIYIQFVDLSGIETAYLVWNR